MTDHHARARDQVRSTETEGLGPQGDEPGREATRPEERAAGQVPQPLSDERIDHIWDTHVGQPSDRLPLTISDIHNFSRAIEAEVLSHQAQSPKADTSGAETAQEPQAWTTYAHIDASRLGKAGLFVDKPGTSFCVPLFFGRAIPFDDHRDPT